MFFYGSVYDHEYNGEQLFIAAGGTIIVAQLNTIDDIEILIHHQQIHFLETP